MIWVFSRPSMLSKTSTSQPVEANKTTQEEGAGPKMRTLPGALPSSKAKEGLKKAVSKSIKATP